MKKILSWLWQAPQHLLALLIEWVVSCRRVRSTNSKVFMKWGNSGSMSLGNYIFLSEKADKYTMVHECNHSRQSLVLGPLYLLIIGLPSLVHCGIWMLVYNTSGKVWDYYSFYTEHWMFKD